MQVITEREIQSLNISPLTAIEWVVDALRHKADADLPPKIWQHFPNDVFINTMPCCHAALGRYAVKVVSRHPGHKPALKSTILLVDMATGNCLACLEGDYITALRTGAVAALAGRTFANHFENSSVGFVGLGTMAHATARCLHELFDVVHDIWLLAYKDHAERFLDEFSGFKKFRFHIAESRNELVSKTNMLYSCVTVLNEQFLPASAYPPGYTLIPVHTKGFQDCDVIFDKVFGDDTGYLKHFQHFNDFKFFAEFSNVLEGNVSGRETPNERILCYNIGLALYDLWFASKIYDKILQKDDQ